MDAISPPVHRRAVVAIQGSLLHPSEQHLLPSRKPSIPSRDLVTSASRYIRMAAVIACWWLVWTCLCYFRLLLSFAQIANAPWVARTVPMLNATHPLPGTPKCGAGVTPSCPVPRWLHWTHKTGMIPNEWAEFPERCRSFNPGWNFTLWTDERARNLIRVRYGKAALALFDAYPFGIQRADALRYYVLHAFGVIYMDLNRGCLAGLDELRIFPSLLQLAEPVGVTNDFISATRGHPLLKALIDELPRYAVSWGVPYVTIMFSTGPMFLSSVWANLPRSTLESSGIWIMNQTGRLPGTTFFGRFDYAQEKFSGSWHGPDAAVIKELGGVLGTFKPIRAFLGWIGRNWWLLGWYTTTAVLFVVLSAIVCVVGGRESARLANIVLKWLRRR